MTDSLVLADVYELIPPDDQVVAQTAPYQLTDVQGDLGSPVPDTATVEGQLLDGERVTGSRSANRTVVLPIIVYGATRPELSQRVEALMAVVNSGAFRLTWTPDGGLPMILDGARGTGVPEWNIIRARKRYTKVVLTFPASPFGRSVDALTVLTTGSTLSIDDMESTAPSGATLDATEFAQGAHSAKIPMTRVIIPDPSGGIHTTYYYTAPVASKTLSAPVDLLAASETTVAFFYRWVPPSTVSRAGWDMAIALTLGDGANVQRVTSAPLHFAEGAGPWRAWWAPLSLFGDIDLTHVTTYAVDITVTPRANNLGGSPPATSNYWIDDLRGYPPAAAVNATSHGHIVTIPSVVGSARAPIAVQVSLASATAFAGVVLHTPPAAQDPDLTILAALGPTTDETVVVADPNCRYDGTYAIWLVRDPTFGGGNVGNETVTVDITQKQNGTTVATEQLQVRAYDAAVADPAYMPEAGFLMAGVVTLPLRAIPGENNGCEIDIRVRTANDTATPTRWSDLMLLDTLGQTVVNGSLPIVASTLTTDTLWVDEPDPAAPGLSQVYAAAGTDRTNAVSVLGTTDQPGGPLMVTPGDGNRILALTEQAPPNIVGTYYPRWLYERTA